MTDELTKNMTSDEFKRCFFLKEQLIDFCRDNNLKISGTKRDLEQRIIYYLDTGEKLDNTRIDKLLNKHSVITEDTLIGENFVCSQKVRDFFEKEIGPTFIFKVSFQKWLKKNPDKTYGDAIQAYHRIKKNQKAISHI